MPKITFLGAGSMVFAKNILGDSMLKPALRDSHIALYDIDPERLSDSKLMLENLNANINENRSKITTHLGVENRKKALDGADYVINAIQVGGYKPSTVIDFEIPKKYGLRQTIADTLGIGGIFRALRTIPVMFDFAREMETVCPNAWLLNYTNPASMNAGAMLRGTGVKTVALCHSVQNCARKLLQILQMLDDVKDLRWRIAGINHQAWLLDIRDGNRDLYPEVRRRGAEALKKLRKLGGAKVEADARKRLGDKWRDDPDACIAHNMVRLEIMNQFGYYHTESSEHASEYVPWFIKAGHPELIDEYNIPLDEYITRCIDQIENWKKQRKELVGKALTHEQTQEFGSGIMNAMETDVPFRIHGNVLNNGLITNLPSKAVVEVPCLVDKNGVQGCYVGDLPEVCAAINRLSINVQLLTLEALLTGKKDPVYQAAMLDSHAAAELTLDEIRNMCDDLFEAHGDMLPKLT
ncbi:MAG: alpha-glucosidase/alpha-galactosidase [Phycisphaerae bacterium]|nr:alpha-glucosidase/alpha-galactosidase [Phycisphaerae bacterium]